jgi:aerobic carbon-monoxide dehydrogenase medium subunit
MYPSRFRYEAPRSLDDAIALLRDAGDSAKVLAGGQSLVPMMKLRFASPELLVDINGIGGLDYLRADADGSLHIGALCRHADLEWSSLLGDTQPTMAAAAPMIADPLVRNRGTLVGSLCHADPQGDWAAVMMALGGSVVARGSSGRRTIPVASFVTGPFETALAYDEIAVEAVVPPATGTRAGGYLKLERRVGDFATCGAAVAVELAGGASGSGGGTASRAGDASGSASRTGGGGTVIRAGIGLTGVGGATINAAAAAAALVGKPLTAESIAEAADLAAAAAQPRSDHRGSADYKRHMVRTFVTRILGGTLDALTEEAA